jgi:hypothetical protein
VQNPSNFILMGNLKNKNHATGRREFLSMLSAAATLGLVGSNGFKEALSVGQAGYSGQSQPNIPTIDWVRIGSAC